jgi:hypothetical protein
MMTLKKTRGQEIIRFALVKLSFQVCSYPLPDLVLSQDIRL